MSITTTEFLGACVIIVLYTTFAVAISFILKDVFANRRKEK
jgi:hypothetical protein